MRALLTSLAVGITLVGCTQSPLRDGGPVLATAAQHVGKNEQDHTQALQQFMNIDPVRVPWCAAFVNTVLSEHSIPGSDTVHSQPLLARSFLHWGLPRSGDPHMGDVVVFPRGNTSWQGHVGFYVGNSVDAQGKTQWIILGGNQADSVNFSVYDPHSALSVRYHSGQL